MQRTDIPGWFQWRTGQEEAVRHFPAGSRFVEVGNYLGRSLCSLADVAAASGKRFSIVGVDTCRGTFAGDLHRNVIRIDGGRVRADGPNDE